jgi:outer membrane protein assembly factor BamB
LACRTAFAAIAGVILFSLSAPADDAPSAKSKPTADSKSLNSQLSTLDSWPSFRNGNEQRGIAHTKLPEKLELLWKHQAGEMVASTAAIVDGRVYAASLKGEVFCLDLKTGKRLWTYQSKENAKPNEFQPGFKSSPTVTADGVYLGDEEGVFHAIDRATGKKKWTIETGGEIVSSASVLPDQDKIIFGSYDNSLYCLKLSDGSKVWQFQTEGMVNCSPAIAGDFTFVTGCDEHLRVIDIRTGKQEKDMPLGTYLIASPAVANNMLYVGTYASEVVAVDWKTEKTIWSYKDEAREFPYHSSAAVGDDVVVVGGRDKRLHCIDRKTGNKIWTFNTKAKVDSSPVIVGDRVFVGSDDKTIYGLRLSDGNEVWRFAADGPVSASPAVAEGCLVIGTESKQGTIYCFGAKK